MKLGMPLSDYERKVGPLNKHFHETAEAMILATPPLESVIPLNPDEDNRPDMNAGKKDKPRRQIR